MRRRSEQGFAEVAVVLVVVVIIAAAGVYVYQRNQAAKQASTTSQSSMRTRPGVVAGIQFSSTVDAKGTAVSPKTAFAPADGKINTVLTLKKAPKDARIEFIRYRDDKYIDNGSVKLNKDNAQVAGFDFVPKTGKTHPKGKYKVKVYTNGVYERAATYTIQ